MSIMQCTAYHQAPDGPNEEWMNGIKHTEKGRI